MARRSSPSAKGAQPAAKAKAVAKATDNTPAPVRARSARQKEPTLADLKRQVFNLAKVSSTKELKRTSVDLHHLDFRLKTSWRSALEVLQQAAASMADWDRSPPEEYRELFAEIDQAAAAYGASIDQGLKLSSQLRQAADDLEALSGELLEEAGALSSVVAGLPEAAAGPSAELRRIVFQSGRYTARASSSFVRCSSRRAVGLSMRMPEPKPNSQLRRSMSRSTVQGGRSSSTG